MIGELRHRITFQEKSLTPDGGGGFNEEWQTSALHPEVYAAVIPLSGGEQLRYHQLAAAVTHRVRIRYRTGVTADMRIVKDGTVYDIASVTDSGGLGVWLEILVVERGS